MLKVGGFPEYTPQQQALFDQVKAIIEETYQSFGYSHIETPAVEKHDVLLKGGEEATKEIFGLYGMASGPEDVKPYALNFDLTIPFARYVLDQQGQLVFPFKRYQIQHCRRGERPQRGRFRQFLQADIDVIWRQDGDEVKHIFYDAELIYMLRLTLERIAQTYLPAKSITTHINNRNVLGGLFTYLVGNDAAKKTKLGKLFDSYYKLGEEKFYQELEALLTGVQVGLVREFLQLGIQELSPSVIPNDEFAAGVEQIQEMFGYLSHLHTGDATWFVYDPFIVRGLDYYTGTVFENIIEDDIELGSICSGGRYANLTQSIAPKSARFDGVGGSIGVSRLFSLILELQKKQPTQTDEVVRVDYLILHFAKSFKQMIRLADQFRKEGKKVELYPSADKLKKQFSYADKQGVPYVVICGEEEFQQGNYKLKDMKTGKEEVCILAS